MFPRSIRAMSVSALMLAAAMAGTPALAAADPGKKACAQEARKLCPVEMRAMSRKRVEVCMIVKIDQTSPICHAAMLQIKTEREGQDRNRTQRAR